MLCNTLSELHFVGGVSNTYEDFGKLALAVNAASEAIRFGQGRHPSQNLFFYEDYIPDMLRCTLLKEYDAEMFIPAQLLRLILYDREHGSDLCRVLRTLLNNNMSCTDAARALYTHRNTVLNRLNRIREVFQMDLDDPAYRTKLRLAFLLLDETPY